jgi:cytochrome c-type biogenesis protein CcmF
MQPLWGPLALSVALGALAWSFQTGRSMLAPVGATLAAWLVLGALADLATRVRLREAGAAEVLRRARNLPRADWGKALAHAGLGVSIFGIAAISAWSAEDIRLAHPGDRFEVAGYAVRFDGIAHARGPNYAADRASVTVSRDGREVATLHPEKRLYDVQGMATTEAGISRGATRDLYVSLGDPQGDGWAIRTYVKSFANWIWAGAFLMALGGIVSLSDRRYRIGAPARHASPAAVPAE